MSPGIMSVVLSATNKATKVHALSVSAITLNMVHVVAIVANRTISLAPEIAETASWDLNIEPRSAGMIVDVRSIIRNANLSLINNGSRNLRSVVVIKSGRSNMTTTMRDAQQIA